MYQIFDPFKRTELAKVLVRAKQPLAAQVADAVTAAEVPDTSGEPHQAP